MGISGSTISFSKGLYHHLFELVLELARPLVRSLTTLCQQQKRLSQQFKSSNYDDTSTSSIMATMGTRSTRPSTCLTLATNISQSYLLIKSSTCCGLPLAGFEITTHNNWARVLQLAGQCNSRSQEIPRIGWLVLLVRSLVGTSCSITEGVYSLVGTSSFID
ncbi:uncharacterized protein LY89DRAFT_292421 [Mollisia scopiformis]|uniref:Uncharacterized protein n=1 Tax=Mollisia scopiformis TaxID=149040 RepID=A0A194XRC3_MOLSC|nr:uncharacterized protein LY89DRAFT_292421 [Mollisia scopiformis]KUJ22277.1 hypothetical protein LY89DRAFT_292421 [Mollisia scopiformis]